jgi:glutamate dehydrogenase (NAD(P)+)
MIVAREIARHLGFSLNGARIAVQGFGNVGSVSADLLAQQGAKVVAVADWMGGVYSDKGLDVAQLIDYASRHPQKTVAGFPGADAIDNAQLLALDLDVLVPAALENQITTENASKVRAKLIVEGANGPTTPEAHRQLYERGVTVVPDILANSGGVTVSYFEWVQDRHGYFWSEQEVNSRLESKICEAVDAVLRTATRYKTDLRTAAYIVAIDRVATVTRMRGMYA